MIWSEPVVLVSKADSSELLLMSEKVKLVVVIVDVNELVREDAIVA